MDFSTNLSGSALPCGAAMTSNKYIVLYADAYPVGTPNGVCDALDSSLTTYTITRGATLAPYTGVAGTGLCVGNGSSCQYYAVNRLDVSFTRPNPEAKICVNGSSSSCYTYAEVSIIGTDGSTRTIAVRENGQVSVKP